MNGGNPRFEKRVAWGIDAIRYRFDTGSTRTVLFAGEKDGARSPNEMDGTLCGNYLNSPPA
jgi:hypothetical protein